MTAERALLGMRDALRASVNADGGWGYYAGRSSRLEATCWAALALWAGAAPSARQALLESDFFVRLRRGDGLIIDAAEAAENRPNLAFNALAAVLFAHGDAKPRAAAIAAALVQHKGIRVAPSTINRQDNSLQGWGWIDGTFSWVEPTCWCAIALKKVDRASAEAHSRLAEAERLLGDRCCDTGGWNYGNANMLGQNLRPYVPTTAVALLALQDRRDAPCVARGLAWLVEHRVVERSAMALALTSLTLRHFGLATDDVDQALLEQWDRTAFLGNTHLTAMAFYSLTAGVHGAEAFRV